VRFVVAAALAALALVLAPLLAHLLRRARPQPRPFPPAALVPPSRPKARRRARLEDRALLAVRALAVVALALLGAGPLLRCSRLAVGRNAGASVALVVVVDDSLSMRATGSTARTRFEAARRGAADLVAGARDGDAIGLVLAGSPARVALAPTGDLRAAAASAGALAVSDRATDLDGALALARAMVRDLPQADRRIVLLSDLCDGHPGGAALGEGLEVPLWAPPKDLDAEAHDCALVRADLKASTVVARVACSDDAAARGRALEARAGRRTVASTPLGWQGGVSPAVANVSLALPAGADEPDHVALVGPADSIAHDDRCPIGRAVADISVAVVSERAASGLATGGPPPAEQALAALDLGVLVRPIATVPDTAEELAPLAALVLDDPAGLGPEARRAIGAWLERGGVALVALGPRAAASPLGASLEPFLSHAPRWESPAPAGIEPASGAAVEGLADLRPRGRAAVDPEPGGSLEVLVRWSDGAPWLAQRAVGRGVALALALPLDPDVSDLPVRPAFLSLLDRVVELARARGGARRIDVGGGWALDGHHAVEVRHAGAPVPLETRDGRSRLSPTVAGRYELKIDGVAETRIAAVPEREVDLRPRKLAAGARDAGLGATESWVDTSRYLVFVLLALLAAEMLVRTLASWRPRPAPP
jgi:hypothetical protein